MSKKQKIITRLKDTKSSLSIPYCDEREYYDRLEAQLELLEDILTVDFGMTSKELKEL